MRLGGTRLPAQQNVGCDIAGAVCGESATPHLRFERRGRSSSSRPLCKASCTPAMGSATRIRSATVKARSGLALRSAGALVFAVVANARMARRRRVAGCLAAATSSRTPRCWLGVIAAQRSAATRSDASRSLSSAGNVVWATCSTRSTGWPTSMPAVRHSLSGSSTNQRSASHRFKLRRPSSTPSSVPETVVVPLNCQARSLFAGMTTKRGRSCCLRSTKP